MPPIQSFESATSLKGPPLSRSASGTREFRPIQVAIACHRMSHWPAWSRGPPLSSTSQSAVLTLSIVRHTCRRRVACKNVRRCRPFSRRPPSGTRCEQSRAGSSGRDAISRRSANVLAAAQESHAQFSGCISRCARLGPSSRDSHSISITRHCHERSTVRCFRNSSANRLICE